MKRRLFAALMGLMMLFSLTACGAAKSDAAMDMAAPGMTTNGAFREESKMESESFDSSMNYGGDIYYEEPSAPMEDKVETGTGSLGPVEQKLIRTAWMEMETTEFDEASKGLAQLTEDFGGYYETSTLTNRNSGSRWGNYVIRIPAEEYTAFLNQMGELCHVTRQESNQEDISEVYYDTAGRLKTQQIKLERLQTLLAKAEFMEDIITIESAISETEWQIDSLSGTLRHYDSKVDYATVNVTLHEVYKLSNVETVPDTFGERMGNAFGDGMKDFVDGLEDLAVGFAYSWMWWLLIAAIVVLVIRTARKRIAKKLSLKKQKAGQSEEQG
ncbi:MAG: DUF4349 domain-containing protein [Ruminococcaceae bacterium]|nr:DUF4349 domain-containing protein [Oscillospiraceae bacterium]